ncbi:PH domain-containing protein [Oceanobacillus sp. CFH 90083]|uniref:PH domain-containing protein n=1 Tax=Oceanobacillus sp. CFH 90083 TaxID=2592336 RepID=UPI001D135F69|nr:PH domain-containing protein [Oceanobacillus sp. CFH 90083]
MIKDIPSVKRSLSKESIKVWLINDILSNIIGLFIFALSLYLSYYFSWKEWIGLIMIGLIILTVIDMSFSPFKIKRRYKYWRFGINEEFLQLKSGSIYQKHQIIPMAKIQAVSIHQSPLLRKYNLYKVKVNTITTTHIIPVLHGKEAMEVRQQIASYANVKEPEA